MTSTIPATWKRRLSLTGGGAVCLLGLDLVSITSRVLTLVGVMLVAAGLAWLVRALLFLGPRDGALYLRRKQITLMLATGAACLVLAVSVAASIRLGPTERLRRLSVGDLPPQSTDDEIGWAPQGPPQYVGQRLQVIDPEREHIVVMGDSILYGLDLPEEETVTHYLGEKYPKLQVLNASVSGYSIDQYYLYLKRILPRTRPRAIVTGIFSGNDYQITGLEYSWGHSKPLFVARDGELVLAGKAATCIDHLAQSLLFRFLWTRVETARATIQLLCSPRQLTVAENDDVIRLLFRKMDDLARERGIPILHVLLPTRGGFRTTGGDEYRYTSKYRDLRRIMREGGHAVLEFNPEGNDSERQGPLYIDGGHFRAMGQRLMAEEIERWLSTKGGLAP